MLERLNSDESAAQSMAWYMQVVRFSEPYEYAGADLLASWFQRNARYLLQHREAGGFAEGSRAGTSPGHLRRWTSRLLRQFAAADPNVTLRKLSDFASH